MIENLNSFKKVVVSLLILSVLLSWVVTTLVLYSQNSLFFNNNWVVAKRMSQLGLTGSDEFLLTRFPLSRNQLNLAAYYGYQEIGSKEKFDFDEIRFDLNSEKESYVDFYYKTVDEVKKGWRISFSELYNSGQFVADQNGKFLDFKSLNRIATNQKKINVNIKFHKNEAKLFINSSLISQISIKPFCSAEIGFRGGPNDIYVDKIYLYKNSNLIFSETFDLDKHFGRIFVMNFAISFFLLFLIVNIFESRKRIIMEVSALVAGVIYLIVSYFTYDYFFYSDKVYIENGITKSLINDGKIDTSFEAVRHKFFNSLLSFYIDSEISYFSIGEAGYSNNRIWSGPIDCFKEVCRVSRNSDILRYNPSAKFKILFIGSSQTIGAGAKKLEDTFFYLFHKEVQKTLSLKSAHSFNLSVSAGLSTDLFDESKKFLNRNEPDYVYINLSSNDILSCEIFGENIKNFIEFFKNKKTHIVLMLEANDPNSITQKSLQICHRKLLAMSGVRNVSLLDVNEVLRKKTSENSGWIWNDAVHLTKYGNQILAEVLIEHFRKLKNNY